MGQLSKETSSIINHTNNNSDSNNNYTQAILPPLVQTSNEELALSNNIPTTEQPHGNICNNLDSNTNNNLNYLGQVYAYELQAQYEADAASELLARKLQQEEEDRIRNTTHRNRPVLSSAPGTTFKNFKLKNVLLPLYILLLTKISVSESIYV